MKLTVIKDELTVIVSEFPKHSQKSLIVLRVSSKTSQSVTTQELCKIRTCQINTYLEESKVKKSCKRANMINYLIGHN